MMKSSTWAAKHWLSTIFIGFSLFAVALHFSNVSAAVGDVEVTIYAAPNLVVDSNVLSPSTEAPRVATVVGRFCNNTGASLDNVVGYIGDYNETDENSSTPGIYPTKTDDTIGGQFYSGTYSFTHLGGPKDGTRIIGSIPDGECRYQYWSFVYPNLASDGSQTIPAWGSAVKPDDDLFLEFDVWAAQGTDICDSSSDACYASHTATMRNEISALANKIEPNGNPGGLWFNTTADTVAVGETITTNGIRYRLGNVRFGFDNDGNLVPDYNAWLQPFGNDTYDPSCFRLIEVSGTLTVTRQGPDLIIPFNHQLNQANDAPLLYFSDLPPDNTDVNGLVYYTFMALGGPCSVPVSPYQEVASGYDNEKFNGDYGAGGPGTINSYGPDIDFDKSGPTSASEGGASFTYSIPFSNTGKTSMGLGISGGVIAPFVISDTVPAGLEYVGGSATMSFSPGNSGSYNPTVYYSTNGGITWDSTDPGTVASSSASPVVIQWWFDQPLQPGDGGTAYFDAQVPTGYIAAGGDPFIENCADARLSDGAGFVEACHVTVVSGNNSVGDFVWADDGAGGGVANNGFVDGSEAAIGAVTVYLYWDKNGDGSLDGGDVRISSQQTNGSGGYDFTSLPDARYIVVVDELDSDIPTGYAPTTPKKYAVDLDSAGVSATGIDYNDADFGFGPVLVVNKTLRSGDPAYEGDDVEFRIDLTNRLPGSPSGNCQYTVYASITPPADGDPPDGVGNGGGSNDQWSNPSFALGYPDNQYAITDMSNNSDILGLSGFNYGNQGGTITGVELILYAKEVVDFRPSDDLIVRVYYNNATLAGGTFTYDTALNGPAGTEYVFREDITSLRGWTWSDFANNLTEMQVEGNKGGNPTGDVGVDAAAYIITTDQVCSDPSTTIATLPLTDTYDADLLQFVSAVPAHTSNTTSGSPPNSVGTVTWSNLGPLAPGSTKSVTVTFTALDPGGQISVNTINTATVTSAFFGNGRAVNDDEDTDDVNILPTGSIAGVVYSDGNSNGWQATTGYDSLGSNDFGIPNVTMTLYGCYDTTTTPHTLITDVDNQGGGDTCAGQGSNDGAWEVVATTTTASNGSYSFTGLRLGYYYVAVTSGLPGGTQNSEPIFNAPNNGATCGDCNGTWNPAGNGTTINNTRLTNTNFNPIGAGDPLGTPNEDITNVNFGYSGVPAIIYGDVYSDEDADAIQETAEAGIGGVTVRLCSDATCSGTVHDTTSTAADGSYSFNATSLGVTGQPVFVVVTQPINTTQTEDPDLGPGTHCSGAQCDDATTTALNVSPGETSGSHDFGYTPSGSYDIGDTLYRDWNGDGDQDTGEEGLANITVYLYEDEDNDGVIDAGVDALMRTAITDANGNYLFANLPDGNYIVVVATGDADFPANHSQTGDPDEAGTCTTCDSRSVTAAISGNDDLDNDFGYQPTGVGSIGDYVWRDSDADAIQDSSENGIGGVTVNLYQDDNGDGVIDATDALAATTVTLDVNIIDGAIDTSNNGSIGAEDDATLQGVEVIDGRLDVNGDGTVNGNDDGTYFGISIIDGRLDVNGDGAITAADDGDLDGYYQLLNLAAGDYIVEIAQSEFGSGQELEDLSMTTSGATYTYTAGQVSYEKALAAGEAFDGADFGFEQGLIGDYIWRDDNGNGEPDAGEPGISGVSVTLYIDNDGDGVVSPGDTIYDYDKSGTPGDAGDTITTDANGLYEFGGLPAGDYVVVVTPPANHTLTGDPDAYALNSFPYPPCDPTDTVNYSFCDNWYGVTLTAGKSDRTADFGYQPEGVIGDRLWIDADGDGSDNGGVETGIAYITVTLYLDDGNGTYDGGDSIVESTETDGDGTYSFGGLTAGVYFVVVNTADVDFPAGLSQTFDPDEANPCSTCDSVGATSLALGGVDLTRDFGYRFSGTNTITGTVWHDDDGGGQTGGTGDIDGGETVRYEGVTVYLWNCGTGTCNDGDEVLVGTTTTASDGTYIFSDLAGDAVTPQTYAVVVNPGAPNLAGTTATTTTAYDGNPFSDPSVTFNSPGGGDAAQRDFGFQSSMDMGDLPASYDNTVLSDNGARHIIGSVYFGQNPPDADPNGQESATAGNSGDGDDNRGADDEDGVSRSITPWSDGTNGGTVEIDASVCTATCYVAAWIDWGRDGVFNDASEKIIVDQPVSGATNSISFDVPAGTFTGIGSSITFNARFRLYASSTGGLAQPTGLAINGEVEDYQWTFAPTAVTLMGYQAAATWPGPWTLLLALLGLFTVALLIRLNRTRRIFQP